MVDFSVAASQRPARACLVWAVCRCDAMQQMGDVQSGMHQRLPAASPKDSKHALGGLTGLHLRLRVDIPCRARRCPGGAACCGRLRCRCRGCSMPECIGARELLQEVCILRGKVIIHRAQSMHAWRIRPAAGGCGCAARVSPCTKPMLSLGRRAVGNRPSSANPEHPAVPEGISFVTGVVRIRERVA